MFLMYRIDCLPPDLIQPVWWQLRDVCEVLELWVVCMHSNQLVVLLALVKHLHDTDGAHPHEAHGHNRLLHRDTRVQGTYKSEGSVSIQLVALFTKLQIGDNCNIRVLHRYLLYGRLHSQPANHLADSKHWQPCIQSKPPSSC